MQKQKTSPVKNVHELIYLMTVKINDFENGEITRQELKAYSTATSAIFSGVKAHVVASQFNKGIMETMDFLLTDHEKAKKAASTAGFKVVDIGKQPEIANS